MLAPRELPDRYEAWNRTWRAPFGGRWRSVAGLLPEAITSHVPVPVAARLYGPFGFMWNATTRRFEYPWTYFTIDPRPGLRVLEIGGGIAGLQFVLARAGCEVYNVDPFLDFGSGTPLQRGRLDLHARLNAAMGTDVRLHVATLDEADLEGPFDVIYSVSTLEHIPRDDLERTLRAVTPLLGPDGRLVLTVDLFLDLAPFSSAQANRWGTNVSMRWVEEVTGCRLVDGDPAQLFGYDEFSADAVLVGLAGFNMNQGYPELVQCAVYGRGVT